MRCFALSIFYFFAQRLAPALDGRKFVQVGQLLHIAGRYPLCGYLHRLQGDAQVLDSVDGALQLSISGMNVRAQGQRLALIFIGGKGLYFWWSNLFMVGCLKKSVAIIGYSPARLRGHRPLWGMRDGTGGGNPGARLNYR